MRQPHCLSGLLPSLSLCMWLGEDSAGCVARAQLKLLRFFSFFFGPRPSQALCIVPLSFLRQPMSARDENYSRLDRKFGATAVLGWPAERAEMDRGGGKGAVVCPLYAAFCYRHWDHCWWVECVLFLSQGNSYSVGISRNKRQSCCCKKRKKKKKKKVSLCPSAPSGARSTWSHAAECRGRAGRWQTMAGRSHHLCTAASYQKCSKWISCKLSEVLQQPPS